MVQPSVDDEIRSKIYFTSSIFATCHFYFYTLCTWELDYPKNDMTESTVGLVFDVIKRSPQWDYPRGERGSQVKAREKNPHDKQTKLYVFYTHTASPTWQCIVRLLPNANDILNIFSQLARIPDSLSRTLNNQLIHKEIIFLQNPRLSFRKILH